MVRLDFPPTFGFEITENPFYENRNTRILFNTLRIISYIPYLRVINMGINIFKLLYLSPIGDLNQKINRQENSLVLLKTRLSQLNTESLSDDWDIIKTAQETLIEDQKQINAVLEKENNLLKAKLASYDVTDYEYESTTDDVDHSIEKCDLRRHELDWRLEELNTNINTISIEFDQINEDRIKIYNKLQKSKNKRKTLLITVFMRIFVECLGFGFLFMTADLYITYKSKKIYQITY